MKDAGLYSKAVNEALALMKANIDVLKKHRGGKFLLKDLKPYVKVVESFEPYTGQEKTVFDLHKESVKNHFSILCDLTETIKYTEEPYTEHIQSPALMEILYDRDTAFRSFVEKFIKELDRSEALIAREAARKHSGFYGPVCVYDFALTPGSTANVLNQVLRGMKLSDKERQYARTVLASKSWGMNGTYVFGWRYIDAVEKGRPVYEAVKEEIGMLKYCFDRPMEAQTKLMNELGVFSFGIDRFQKRYMKAMEDVVDKALEKEVNYANILSVPALSVGDIGHHLCQSSYDLYDDDFSLEMLEGVVEVVENTLKAQMDYYESLGQILGTATGAAAAAVTYMMESEGFTSDMAIELMTKRFKNFIQKYPHRGVGIEFHNVDYMDVVFRGNRILHSDGAKINGMPIDFTPLTKRGIVRNYKGCIYPNCGINRIFSRLMALADHFCLINIEPVTMALVTNILASDPKNSLSPIKSCKKCSVSAVSPNRCQYCERTRAV